MKMMGNRYVGKFRRALATTFACTIVLGIPLLGVNQYTGFFHTDPRKATPLPVFQERAVDQNPKHYELFKQPLISITFDDGWETTYTAAMPLLQKYGIHTTQYVLSGYEDYKDYLTWDQIKAMSDAGHEIACHTDSHPDLRTITDDKIREQLAMCKDKIFKNTKINVVSFASPYGSSDTRTIDLIKQDFQSQRNTEGDPSNGVNDADVNLKSEFDPYEIIGVTISKETTLQQIQSLIDYTVKNNGWLVLTYHQAGDSSSKWAEDPAIMEQQFKLLSESQVRIVTVSQAISSRKLVES